MSELSRAQRAALRESFGEYFVDDLTLRTARSIDASCYRIVPKGIVRPQHPGHVVNLVKLARSLDLPITFRGAGTSLSGQAIGPGLLVEVGWGTFRQFNIYDRGHQVATGPGVIGGAINAALRPYHRRLGPDPASIGAAMMGGILSNNASGMCCGTRYNSYQTLESMVFVLANGLRLNSNDPDSDRVLKDQHHTLWQGLKDQRTALLANPEWVSRLRKKHAIKNTIGYGLQALLDYENPIDMLIHLLIGSEGTLGFIERAVLNTVDDPPYRATALIRLSHLDQGAELANKCTSLGADAVELMDARSIEAARHIGTLCGDFTEITPFDAAVLVEFQGSDPLALSDKANQLAHELPPGAHFAVPPSSDPKLRAQLWHMRKSLYPSVGGRRPLGATMIVEDICVAPDRMPELILCLNPVFDRFGFDDRVVFGHAKDGNLHFIMHTCLEKHDHKSRYAGFMETLAEIVVGQFDGSLKAEHGTGRNMAPFVAREWGDDLYQVMKSIKQLFDPDMLLNPGVIFSEHADSYLRDMKQAHLVDAQIDGCMDCGFCELGCPSNQLTLSPRQRIALARAGMSSRYQVEDTCAVDGACALACPLGINTGQWVKQQRQKRSLKVSRMAAKTAARHWWRVLAITRRLLGFSHWLQRSRMGAKFLHTVSWPYHIAPSLKLPLPSSHWSQPHGEGIPLIYLPTCLHAVMSQAQFPPQGQMVSDILGTLGYAVRVASTAYRQCCGTVFFSKGQNEAGQIVQNRLIKWLNDVTQEGAIPVVVDVAPCAQTMKDRLGTSFQILDLIDLISQHKDRLPSIVDKQLILHPTCSMRGLGTDVKLEEMLVAMGADVWVPNASACCGFAGDRGFLHPELTQSATADQAQEIRAFAAEHDDATAISACGTCELAMTHASGLQYSSYVGVLWQHVCGGKD